MEELVSADLLIIVLTNAWVKSGFTVAELETYVKERSRMSKESMRVIPFEFEIPSAYLIPDLDKRQIIKNAADLNDFELRWLLSCGINSSPPGPQDDWETKGRKLTDADGSIPPPPPSRKLTPAERVRLEREVDGIKSLQRILEIAWKTLGRETELPEDPKIAWYKLIKSANELGHIERLCEAAEVDYARLFGPSGSGEDRKGGAADKH